MNVSGNKFSTLTKRGGGHVSDNNTPAKSKTNLGGHNTATMKTKIHHSTTGRGTPRVQRNISGVKF